MSKPKPLQNSRDLRVRMAALGLIGVALSHLMTCLLFVRGHMSFFGLQGYLLHEWTCLPACLSMYSVARVEIIGLGACGMCFHRFTAVNTM